MKRYAPIHVGIRLAPARVWGVMAEDDLGCKLLCEGCTKEEAESLVAAMKGQPNTLVVVDKADRQTVTRIVPMLGVLVLLCGCVGTAPLKGGKATTSQSAGRTIQTLGQGDNPAQVSRQDHETVKTRSYTLPTGSRLEETRVREGESGSAVTNVQAVVVSAPMPVVEREETRAKTELGAAQKDTTREIGAKLSSLKGIVWVGVAMFLFGVASMVYPPLRVIIGSVTTSAAILAGGVALMILPTLIVGNELLILGGVGVAVGGWFFAHRHGKLQGFVDANKNGVDDRLEIENVGGKIPDNS